jgi:nucleotide-binding universal stress UspA family protein
MSRFTSLLLPLDGSAEAAKGLGCALWLAAKLGAALHVLNATPEPLPAPEALARLRVPEKDRSRLVLHQSAAGDARQAVLDAIAGHAVQLAVMSARGASSDTGVEEGRRLGHVAQAVIERTAVPVLLLPRRYREALPWHTMLVATSGEAAADQALAAAVQLAAALGLKVTVLHCAEPDAAAEARALGAYADAPHYEYPRRLEEMVTRAVTPQECRCIEQVVLCRGDAAAQILKQRAERRSSVLALGWHGRLAQGRAPVLKRLLDEAECPVLLVREAPRPRARLKVGEAFEGEAL